MMLRYIGENDAADRITNALEKVFEDGKVLTVDLGGDASTDKFADEICKYL